MATEEPTAPTSAFCSVLLPAVWTIATRTFVVSPSCSGLVRESVSDKPALFVPSYLTAAAVRDCCSASPGEYLKAVHVEMKGS